MTKTIAFRTDSNIYKLLQKAADGERRTMSNFIENALLNYLTGEYYVSDEEMREIIS